VTLEITDAEPLRRSLDVIVPRRHPLSRNGRSLLSELREATRPDHEPKPHSGK
jgi:hypothetical protein